MDTQNGLTAVRGEGDWGVLHENVKESIRKKSLVDTDNNVVITRGKEG